MTARPLDIPYTSFSVSGLLATVGVAATTSIIILLARLRLCEHRNTRVPRLLNFQLRLRRVHASGTFSSGDETYSRL